MNPTLEPSNSVLLRCDGALSPAAAPGSERSPFRTVDMHCHLLVPAVEDMIRGLPGQVAEGAASLATFGARSAEINVAQMNTVGPKLTRVDERLAAMDAMGVDVQAVSIIPSQYCYWAEQDLAGEIVRTVNDAIAALCALHPERLIGLGSVSLQFPTLAAAQLEHGMRRLGFRGVEISTHVQGRNISDPDFEPFWRKADELGAVVFIHPWGTTIGERLNRHYLGNTVGQPLETAVALSNLIFEGTLDRHPGVKLLAAHGGGYLPLYIGRSDHAHSIRPEACGCACRPSDYLRRIWFDSLVYTPAHLASLIDAVGLSQVVLGTDYPFDMGHYDPAGLLKSFAPEVQRAVAGGNAARLLGLDPAQPQVVNAVKEEV